MDEEVEQLKNAISQMTNSGTTPTMVEILAKVIESDTAFSNDLKSKIMKIFDQSGQVGSLLESKKQVKSESKGPTKIDASISNIDPSVHKDLKLILSKLLIDKHLQYLKGKAEQNIAKISSKKPPNAQKDKGKGKGIQSAITEAMGTTLADKVLSPLTSKFLSIIPGYKKMAGAEKNIGNKNKDIGNKDISKISDRFSRASSKTKFAFGNEPIKLSDVFMAPKAMLPIKLKYQFTLWHITDKLSDAAKKAKFNFKGGKGGNKAQHVELSDLFTKPKEMGIIRLKYQATLWRITNRLSEAAKNAKFNFKGGKGGNKAAPIKLSTLFTAPEAMLPIRLKYQATLWKITNRLSEAASKAKFNFKGGKGGNKAQHVTLAQLFTAPGAMLPIRMKYQATLWKITGKLSDAASKAKFKFEEEPITLDTLFGMTPEASLLTRVYYQHTLRKITKKIGKSFDNVKTDKPSKGLLSMGGKGGEGDDDGERGFFKGDPKEVIVDDFGKSARKVLTGFGGDEKEEKGKPAKKKKGILKMLTGMFGKILMGVAAFTGGAALGTFIYDKFSEQIEKTPILNALIKIPEALGHFSSGSSEGMKEGFKSLSHIFWPEGDGGYLGDVFEWFKGTKTGQALAPIGESIKKAGQWLGNKIYKILPGFVQKLFTIDDDGNISPKSFDEIVDEMKGWVDWPDKGVAEFEAMDMSKIQKSLDKRLADIDARALSEGLSDSEVERLKQDVEDLAKKLRGRARYQATDKAVDEKYGPEKSGPEMKSLISRPGMKPFSFSDKDTLIGFQGDESISFREGKEINLNIQKLNTVMENVESALNEILGVNKATLNAASTSKQPGAEPLPGMPSVVDAARESASDRAYNLRTTAWEKLRGLV